MISNNYYRLILGNNILSKMSLVWFFEMCSLGALLIFQILCGRLLSPSDYGLFASLYGFITLISALSHGFRVSMARVTVRSIISSNQVVKMNLLGIMGPVIAAYLVMLAIFVIPNGLGRILNFGSLFSIVLMTANLPILILISFLIGSIQGRKMFFTYCCLISVQAISRILISSVHPILNDGIAALMLAVLISNIVTVLIAFYFCKNDVSLSTGFHFPHILSQGGSAFLSHIIVSLHSSIDVLLVRIFLGELISGNFVIITILGRIILYVSLSFGFVLFPIFTQAFHQKKDFREIFFIFLPITLIVTVMMGILVNLGSGIVTTLFWGNAYSVSGASLIYYSGAMIILAVNYQFIQVLIAKGGNTWLIVFVLIIYLVGFMMLPVYGDTIVAFGIGILATNVLAFLLLVAYFSTYMFAPQE